MEFEVLRKCLLSENSHLYKYYNELNENQKSLFDNSIKKIDFEQFLKCSKKFCEKKTENLEKDSVKPINENIVDGFGFSSKKEMDDFYVHGLEVISKGKIAVITLAGGQASRLGISYPKGMYDVGLASKKSLYQIQAEKIIRLKNICSEKFGTNNVYLPWLIMTSESTSQVTKTFFSNNNYFGLNESDIFIFEQPSVPCMLLNNQRMFLASKSKVATSPNGNGGIFEALYNNNFIDYLMNKGIDAVFVYCVDNILVKVADPWFIGCCHSRNADCANKTIFRTDELEPIGMMVTHKNSYKVLEYSELPTELSNMRKTQDDDSLAFKFGNICNHYFTVDFLKKIVKVKNDLPIHFAKKKVDYIDADTGTLIKPSFPNAIKFEKFVFDVFPFSENFRIFNVDRECEFAPLKNASGKNSPVSCRNALLKLHHKFLKDSGLTEEHFSEENSLKFEISALDSYFGENLNKSI